MTLKEIIEKSAERGYVALDALEQHGYIIVPREPTAEMLDAAWADALGEDAAGVWRSMIEAAPH